MPKTKKQKDAEFAQLACNIMCKQLTGKEILINPEPSIPKISLDKYIRDTREIIETWIAENRIVWIGLWYHTLYCTMKNSKPPKNIQYQCDIWAERLKRLHPGTRIESDNET